MNRWILFGLVCAVLLLAGCSRVQVSQDYRPGMDFSRYHSYRWQTTTAAASQDIRINNPLLQERFRQSIDSALVMRGYLQAAAADFVVSYDYSIQTRIESEPMGWSIGAGFGHHYNYGGIGFGSDIGINQYDVGVLVIDFADAQTGAPIWRGTASQLASTHSTPENTTAYVERMVEAVLSQFPPRE